MANLPQLQRDRRAVEQELEQALTRLFDYETHGEPTLATDARRVTEGLQQLLHTLSTRIQQLNGYPA